MIQMKIRKCKNCHEADLIYDVDKYSLFAMDVDKVMLSRQSCG